MLRGRKMCKYVTRLDPNLVKLRLAREGAGDAQTRGLPELSSPGRKWPRCYLQMAGGAHFVFWITFLIHKTMVFWQYPYPIWRFPTRICNRTFQILIPNRLINGSKKVTPVQHITTILQ